MRLENYMRPKIVYFDEDIQNHIEMGRLLNEKFNPSFFNCRATFLDNIIKNSDYDLILIDDSSNNTDFLSDLLILVDRLQVGLVLISSFDNVSKRVEALDYGVDDYLTRPISENELTARLLNKVKKYHRISSPILRIGNLSLQLSDQKAFINGEECFLTPIEYKLLLILARGPDRIYSKESLIDSLWMGNKYGKSKSIDTHICNLRRKIRGFNYSIKARKGRGVGFVKKREDVVNTSEA